MHLRGVAIGGYRSFLEPQRLRFGGKVTLLAGPNNAGKSNVLSFIRLQLPRILEALGSNRELEFDGLDLHMGAGSDVTVGVGVDTSSAYTGFLELAGTKGVGREAQQLLDAIGTDDGITWIDYLWRPADKKLVPSRQLIESLLEGEGLVRRVVQALTGTGHGKHEDAALELLRRHLNPRAAGIELPPVETVPAFRQVGHGEVAEPWGGNDIIARLAQLQNPTLDQQADKERFEQLNELLVSVTGDAGAHLEIPFDRETIHVHLDGRVLPLVSLGTGIHEVVLLGAAATVAQGSLVCIEEPEVHLHPILQRKFLDYITKETNNTYLITTHSAHLLDAPDAALVSVQLVEGATRLSDTTTPNDRWEVCWELGYRASDIVQSNYVVWVEGPSDRIYLRHWLEHVAPELDEGVHFSIMFYGGRLLAHLSPHDPEVDDFISLRRLNRNLAVVMDSDKGSGTAGIGATKTRVADEVEAVGGLAWITAGREIENYVPRRMMAECLESADLARPSRMGRYDRVYPSKGTDKVKLARGVADRAADLSPLDLKDRILALAADIRTANDLSSETEPKGRRELDGSVSSAAR